MFKIDGFSLLRAGALGAAIAGLLYLMSLTPFFNTILTVMLIAGGVLIPLGTGMYYGYLAPGEETMFQSVVGGAISGLIVGLNAFVMSTASSVLGSLASGVGTSLIIGGIFGAIGAVLGALGGVIWKVIQPPEPAQE
jgi:hypothetical protein